MVDADQRHVQRQCQRFGCHDANDQRSGQPRCIGHRHGIQLSQLEARALHRFVNHRQDALDMSPRGQLGHDTPVALVQFVLRSHNFGEHFATIVDNRSSRLIAGGFDQQYVHGQSSC